MHWRSIGRIINERAAYPTIDRVDGSPRLYFGRRDDLGRSGIFHTNIDLDHPLQPSAISDRPLFDLGSPGTFDADGHAARWVVEAADGSKLMYLIGWNRSHSVPYHLSIGCARSIDGGRGWRKGAGPVMDRSADEPFLCTSPCVLEDNGVFRMWYCGGLGWLENEGKMEPLYRIHHAESPDGLTWRRTPQICIDAFPGGDAIGWPVVWKVEGGYRMLFSYRAKFGYRDDPSRAYRIGFAISEDGLAWSIRNEEVLFERSGDQWDSIMVAYPAFLDDLLFYNGNGFGATGIGVARRIELGSQ